MKIARKSDRSNDQLAYATQEMYKQNLQLAETNKTLTLLREIDEVALSSVSDAAEAAAALVGVLTKDTDFSYAALYLYDQHKTSARLYGYSSRGKLPDEVTHLISQRLNRISLQTNTRGIVHHALTTRKTQITDSFTDVQKSIEVSDNQKIKAALSIESLILCPLIARGNSLGILAIGIPLNKSDISSFIHGLVDRMAGTISIAVDNHILYEELQAATTKVKSQNKKLKEIDEAKDEFVSMASHQLRTPLTVIKGYLSMLLEGDMGKITKQQKQVVQTAFDGAERMVFLIGDLLNVSRLQTGKFLIENKLCDLSAVIANEVEHLQESVHNHQLQLIFDKPNSFPKLMLDETKIRQVVMNFIDNAIYYTPSGGTITVKLESTPKEIMLTVNDTGLGVPKSEQRHLFTKFYRAGNARQMRPDGTGLGLYMAKKIIAAQGGAIIFKSQEGKGSTFGFSLPKTIVEQHK